MAGKAMDKLYKFDENGNLVEVLMPTGIGFVGWYAGPEPPEGYLYCDGSAIGRETYKELFEAVGTLYGAGDGAETFNLPDARGVFFRGDGGENNAAMGTRQGDAIRNITGSVKKNSGDLPLMAAQATEITQTGALYIKSWRSIGNAMTGGTKYNMISSIDFDASKFVPTAPENRPINMAFKPCIRYI